MDWIELVRHMMTVAYTFALVMVCVYGLHRYLLVFLYYRHRRKVPVAPGRFEELPVVTVQLPMYNEKYVAERIIRRTCQIDYPREKLQIQVLDDSTDETVQVASAAMAETRAAGFDVEYIHRTDRTGFKAGAMEHGLATAKGEFVTIFDADFVPEPSILRKSIDYFKDPRVCAVQTRWEHLNREESLLTRTQAIYLDGHFAIEHVARNRSGRFMSFNGTAGTWRKSAIRDAGGWQHDTLTEDMDLSYRAQLRGWKFVYVPDLTAPAELPPEMNAFKAQQFRWTKGGAQTAMKMLPRILLSTAPLKAKIEAFFHLSCFTVHVYVVVLVTLLLPAMCCHSLPWTRTTPYSGGLDIGVFLLATVSGCLFYVVSQYELSGDWRTVLKYLPFLMSLGVGVSLSNTQAVLEGLFGVRSEFVRTPKFGAGSDRYALHKQQADAQPRRSERHLLPYVELVYGVYMTFCAIMSLLDISTAFAAPFFVLFAVGFFYVSILTFQGYAARAAKPVPQTQKA